jgi:hypothetical protein
MICGNKNGLFFPEGRGKKSPFLFISSGSM